MNINGFRYCVEVPKSQGSGWKPIISGDDRELLEKFYLTHITEHRKAPARLRDRSTDAVLRFHTGALS